MNNAKGAILVLKSRELFTIESPTRRFFVIIKSEVLKLNNALEIYLRESDMIFSVKANLVLRGKPYLFCPDCRCGGKTDFMGLIDTNLCIPKCDYALMVWLFNARQWKVWVRSRPQKLKQMDIENAVREGRIIIETIKIEEGLAVTKIIKVEETLVRITEMQEKIVIQIEKGVLRESAEIQPLPLFLLNNT